MTTNGGISFWWQQIGVPELRPTLSGSIDVDVAIVGGGYTGLWTAYYLKKADPSSTSPSSKPSSAATAPPGATAAGCYNGIAGRDRYAQAPRPRRPPSVSSRR